MAEDWEPSLWRVVEGWDPSLWRKKVGDMTNALLSLFFFIVYFGGGSWSCLYRACGYLLCDLPVFPGVLGVPSLNLTWF